MPSLPNECNTGHNSGIINGIISKFEIDLCIVGKNIVKKFEMICFRGTCYREKNPMQDGRTDVHRHMEEHTEVRTDMSKTYCP